MRIALYQIDGKLPNLALAKLARYHVGLGHEVVRFDPAAPWDHAAYDRVYASKLFDFSPAPFVNHKMEIGGPGWGGKKPLPDHIEDLPPLWDLWPDFKANMGFTARGCRFSCGFCVVPELEGRPTSVATVEDLMVRESNFLILLDNDIFGNPNWRDVFDEIKARNLQVNISQGVNLRVLTEEQARALASIRFRNSSNSRSQFNTAWDNPNDEERFLKGFHRVIRAGTRLLYPTLSASDFRTGYRMDTEAGKRQREQRSKPLRDTIAPGGQINPTWAALFMGFPAGWLDGVEPPSRRSATAGVPRSQS